MLSELGIVEPLDAVDTARLVGLDLDAVHSIGIAGPYSSELLIKIHDHDEHVVAAFVHTLGIAGPLNPAELEELLDIGMDRVVVRANELGLSAPDTCELMRVVRNI